MQDVVHREEKFDPCAPNGRLKVPLVGTETCSRRLTSAVQYGPFHPGGELMSLTPPTPETGIRLGRGAGTALRQGGRTT